MLCVLQKKCIKWIKIINKLTFPYMCTIICVVSQDFTHSYFDWMPTKNYINLRAMDDEIINCLWVGKFVCVQMSFPMNLQWRLTLISKSSSVFNLHFPHENTMLLICSSVFRTVCFEISRHLKLNVGVNANKRCANSKIR